MPLHRPQVIMVTLLLLMVLTILMCLFSFNYIYLSLLASLAFSLLITIRLNAHSRAISDLIEAMKRIELGEEESALYIPQYGDSLGLVANFNRMIASQELRKAKLISNVKELDAVLSSMMEGVLAIDTNQRILRINDAAARILGTIANDAVGRTIHETLRHSEILSFVTKALSSPNSMEDEISLQLGGDRILHIYGASLRDQEWNSIGVLIVFNDITRLRHLENVRREFIANVSHELRTPITAIKGFVETLVDGAIESRADTERFLGIISHQADRLSAIFDDLLALSRVEEGNRGGDVELEASSVSAALRCALENCQNKADKKNIKLTLAAPEEVTASINPSLLEQAVTNLIQNAIAYSEANSEIIVALDRDTKGYTISVKDHGIGIDSIHLPRIFERFYRVDKSRSRLAGGTGLGLAIVKHIAESHGGSTSVESTPGVGSIFSIHLPLKDII